MAYRRNLRLYVPYRILTLEGICHGIYLLWWTQKRHISAAAVAAILAFSDLVVMALNVPTGVLADRFGRRRSLIAGSAAQVGGILLLWLCESSAGVALGCVTIAVGDSFRSGAQEALLFESCDGAQFGRRLARADAATELALVGLTLLGGWIAQWAGFHAAWCVEAALALGGLGVALSFREVPRPNEAGDVGRGRWAGVPWSAILPVTLLVAAASGAGFLVPLELADRGAGAGSVANLIALLQLMEGAGAAAAGVLGGEPERRLRLLVAAGALACVLPGPLGAVTLYFLAGAARPLRGELLQQRAAPSNRATVASIAGSADNLVKGFWLPLAAGLRDSSGPLGANALLAALLLAALGATR
ncbi:MAG: MFS transporter [Candidatus Wallbacteria bacterium]|nr:MFS transporter [Candidatus Wallbacteria bacterium]